MAASASSQAVLSCMLDGAQVWAFKSMPSDQDIRVAAASSDSAVQKKLSMPSPVKLPTVSLQPSPLKTGWILCDECHKWRCLPNSIDIKTLPNVWVCRDSTWATGASCSDEDLCENQRHDCEDQNSMQRSKSRSHLNENMETVTSSTRGKQVGRRSDHRRVLHHHKDESPSQKTFPNIPEYLVDGDDNRNQFYSRLYHVLISKGVSVRRFPKISGDFFDMFTAYHEVVRLGGMKRVTELRKWGHIVEVMDIDTHPCQIKSKYERFLYPLECVELCQDSDQNSTDVLLTERHDKRDTVSTTSVTNSPIICDQTHVIYDQKNVESPSIVKNHLEKTIKTTANHTLRDLTIGVDEGDDAVESSSVPSDQISHVIGENHDIHSVMETVGGTLIPIQEERIVDPEFQENADDAIDEVDADIESVKENVDATRNNKGHGLEQEVQDHANNVIDRVARKIADEFHKNVHETALNKIEDIIVEQDICDNVNTVDQIAREIVDEHKGNAAVNDIKEVDQYVQTDAVNAMIANADDFVGEIAKKIGAATIVDLLHSVAQFSADESSGAVNDASGHNSKTNIDSTVFQVVNDALERLPIGNDDDNSTIVNNAVNITRKKNVDERTAAFQNDTVHTSMHNDSSATVDIVLNPEETANNRLTTINNSTNQHFPLSVIDSQNCHTMTDFNTTSASQDLAKEKCDKSHRITNRVVNNSTAVSNVISNSSAENNEIAIGASHLAQVNASEAPTANHPTANSSTDVAQTFNSLIHCSLQQDNNHSANDALADSKKENSSVGAVDSKKHFLNKDTVDSSEDVAKVSVHQYASFHVDNSCTNNYVDGYVAGSDAMENSTPHGFVESSTTVNKSMNDLVFHDNSHYNVATMDVSMNEDIQNDKGHSTQIFDIETCNNAVDHLAKHDAPEKFLADSSTDARLEENKLDENFSSLSVAFNHFMGMVQGELVQFQETLQSLSHRICVAQSQCDRAMEKYESDTQKRMESLRRSMSILANMLVRQGSQISILASAYSLGCLHNPVVTSGNFEKSTVACAIGVRASSTSRHASDDQPSLQSPPQPCSLLHLQSSRISTQSQQQRQDEEFLRHCHQQQQQQQKQKQKQEAVAQVRLQQRQQTPQLKPQRPQTPQQLKPQQRQQTLGMKAQQLRPLLQSPPQEKPQQKPQTPQMNPQQPSHQSQQRHHQVRQQVPQQVMLLQQPQTQQVKPPQKQQKNPSQVKPLSNKRKRNRKQNQKESQSHCRPWKRSSSESVTQSQVDNAPVMAQTISSSCSAVCNDAAVSSQQSKQLPQQAFRIPSPHWRRGHEGRSIPFHPFQHHEQDSASFQSRLAEGLPQSLSSRHLSSATHRQLQHETVGHNYASVPFAQRSSFALGSISSPSQQPVISPSQQFQYCMNGRRDERRPSFDSGSYI